MLFRGRTRRREYWLFHLFLSIFNVITYGTYSLSDMITITYASPEIDSLSLIIIFFLNALALLVPIIIQIAVTVRRLHDLNMSGWWVLLLLVPLVNVILLFALGFLRGTVGSNWFGDDPRKGMRPAETPVDLTPHQRKEVLLMLSKGVPRQAVARHFNVGVTAIDHVKNEALTSVA